MSNSLTEKWELFDALDDLIIVLTTDPGGLDKQKRVDSMIREARKVMAKVKGGV